MMRKMVYGIFLAAINAFAVPACEDRHITTVPGVAVPQLRVSEQQGSPNIVILLADDLGWADLGFRNSDIETPNIDRLAREGMSLERFYVQPICTPTRSALMTARDPMKLGSIYAGFQPWQNGGVSPEEHFMPESFKAAGYQTAMIGKWHLGHTIEPLVPNARGFDHFVGHLNTQINYYDYTVANGYDLQENGVSVKRDETYATDMHGDEAVRYLTEIRDPSRPFFLYIPFLAPHSPMQAPKDLEQKYSLRFNTPFPRKTYAAMVDSLDQAVGRILGTLDAQGLTENTIVFSFRIMEVCKPLVPITARTGAVNLLPLKAVSAQMPSCVGHDGYHREVKTKMLFPCLICSRHSPVLRVCPWAISSLLTGRTAGTQSQPLKPLNVAVICILLQIVQCLTATMSALWRRAGSWCRKLIIN